MRDASAAIHFVDVGKSLDSTHGEGLKDLQGRNTQQLSRTIKGENSFRFSAKLVAGFDMRPILRNDQLTQ
jgi:hypothetical protein